MGLKWANIQDIGIELFEKYPAIDPLTVRFTDLRDKIEGLEEWDDDIHTCNESKLEAVQMAWLEEYRDSQDG